MEQGRSGLTPRTQRRSQNICSDAAKIGTFFYTSKLFDAFLSLIPKIFVYLRTYKNYSVLFTTTYNHTTFLSMMQFFLPNRLAVRIFCFNFAKDYYTHVYYES